MSKDGKIMPAHDCRVSSNLLAILSYFQEQTGSHSHSQSWYIVKIRLVGILHNQALALDPKASYGVFPSSPFCRPPVEPAVEAFAAVNFCSAAAPGSSLVPN